MNKLIYGITVLFCVCVLNTKAQNLICNPTATYGNYQIVGDDINLCGDGVHLQLQLVPGTDSFPPSTDTYAVVQNSYIPEPWIGANSCGIISDDIWSDTVFQLPFNFCFFNQQYNQFIVSANGQVSFDVGLVSNFNNWATTAWGPMPWNDPDLNNTINSPYHDILPTSFASPNGNITWDVYGTAPCRRAVISWDSIAMFSPGVCGSVFSSQQIVLHEQTNEITINIRNKPLCTAWNGGKAYEGIQNAAGTVAFTVSGRNGTQWSASNDSWSFVPAGTASVSGSNVYWIDSSSNTVLDTGWTFDYWNPTDTTIYVRIGDSTDCNFVIIPYKRIYAVFLDANWTSTIIPQCGYNEVQFTYTGAIPIGTATFSWDFGDGSPIVTAPNPVHNYYANGPYNVTLIVNDGTCTGTLAQVVNPIIQPFLLNYNLSDDSVCIGQAITSNNNSIGSNLTYLWDMGDGTTYTSKDINHTYTQGGLYTVTLSIHDNPDCDSSYSYQVYVDGPVHTNFIPNKYSACVYESIYFIDSISPVATRFVYRFGTGDSLVNVHNPSFGYSTPGIYTIELESNYLVCPTDIHTETIEIFAMPMVNLGPDQSICPGTQTITLADNNNPGATYLWHDMTTSNTFSTTSPGTYYVTTSYGPCSMTDSVVLVGDLDCLFMPNAFSPNGDKKNDYFRPYIYSETDVTHFTMHVFERWGKEVYTSYTFKDKGWDGTFNGEPMPTGVYMYVFDIELRDGTKKQFKGDVTLMR